MPTGVYKRKKMPLKERRRRNAERTRRLYAESPEYRRQQKNNKLMKTYGITIEQYEYWSQAFDGVCHICENPCPSGRMLAVDHEHDSKLVRGLLCINCNKGIGNFKDNPELLVKAIEYLNNFKEIKTEVYNALDEIKESEGVFTQRQD